MARSLNVGLRKRENERIERENQAFAKRLFNKQMNGSLSKKKMDEDYSAQMRYKKQIMKVANKKSRLPKLNGRTGLLPPLDVSADGLLDDARNQTSKHTSGTKLLDADSLRQGNQKRVEGVNSVVESEQHSIIKSKVTS